MSQHKALTYAEDKLGVHQVWVNAEQIVLDLQSLYRTHAGFEAEVRDLAFQIEQYKGNILVRETDKNPSMAVTALERHVKLVMAGDEDLNKLLNLHVIATGNREAILADIRGKEMNLKAHVARMNELSGYFNYLASAKNAQLAIATQVNDYPW
jgi:hypothetical protein